MAKRISKEIEIKLRVPQLGRIKLALRRLGAVGSEQVYEQNTLYDTRRQQFRKRGILLRLRVVRPSGGGTETGLLTFKGPGLGLKRGAPRGASGRARYKVREEIEMRVPEPELLRGILGAVGLVPAFRYEKYRTRYRLPRVPGVHVELDETPMGCFLELEGSPQAIDRAARLLGYGHKDYITQSYLGLHLASCRRRGEKPHDMLFARRRAAKK